MLWHFFGQKFERRLNAEGNTSFFLEPDFHMPLFDMGGPSPAFDIDAVQQIFRRRSWLHIKVGAPQDVVKEAAQLLIVCQGKGLGTPSYIPRALVTTSPELKQNEITSVVTKATMAELSSAFSQYSSASGPKYFSARLHTMALFTGTSELNPTSDEVAEFMNGERSAMATDVLQASFSFGEPMPPAPTERDLLRRLQDQFR